jgi:hypothetical protein
MRTRTILGSELPAVSLHPFSLADLSTARLPAGTCLEGAAAALMHAETCGMRNVIVRAVEPDGWVALHRVSVADLRQALATIDRTQQC